MKKEIKAILEPYMNSRQAELAVRQIIQLIPANMRRKDAETDVISKLTKDKMHYVTLFAQVLRELVDVQILTPTQRNQCSDYLLKKMEQPVKEKKQNFGNKYTKELILYIISHQACLSYEGFAPIAQFSVLSENQKENELWRIQKYHNNEATVCIRDMTHKGNIIQIMTFKGNDFLKYFNFPNHSFCKF